MLIKKLKGFSLIELLVGILIASIVSVSVYSLFDRSSKDFSQTVNTNDLKTESTIIFNLIERDLARGGFVHPVRGDLTIASNCIAGGIGITAANAINIVSGTEVSSCYDRPSYDGTTAYRYKVTYKLGDGTAGLLDTNTLYKKIERTDDCTGGDTVADVDPNLASTIHPWQPVTSNIGSITFSYPTIGGSTNSSILDMDINFVSQKQNSLNLDFRKRVFLRNKSLTGSSVNCDNKCPNSKDIFANYTISSNETNWNPDTRNVPSATVVISTNYQNGEDILQWDSALATNYGLTVTFNATTGVLSIVGNTTARNYETFLRTVNYVSLQNTISSRTVFAGTDRQFILVLGFGTLCNNLIGRQVGAVRHFYCYVADNMSGRGALTGVEDTDGLSGNTLWWGQAKLRAENSTYYNLSGYLASITSAAENNYILAKIRDANNIPIAAWFGGTDNQGGEAVLNAASETTWVWSGGPERNQIFYTHDGVNNDGFTNWRTGEPNNCCIDILGDLYNGNTLEANEHFPTVGGEHYTQFSNVLSGTGYWNDLFDPGVTYSPFTTLGYVLEFSSNFPSPTITCSNASVSNRLACVNYFSSFNLVLDDTTYTSPDMVNLCDPTPTDNALPPKSS